MKNKISISFLLFIFLLIAGCSNYQESFTFTGTVEEILVEEEMLVIKEYGGVDEGRKDGKVYEIPVDDVERYSIGQKLEVTVSSKTDEDVWDLDHMKFNIKTVEN
ncbi:hypothetical protein HMPREF1210_00610 [Paenisporosarcina sp. HGH0030]|uniref:hypothetical protein n=1 Tax=Paenisporosarcina sp. HGH0030 TaxID=1078085 RepID=UPI00034E0154|nr:hypothetical protein [Paenisporosarcina sp. HGH0030]EPD53787.1 hypothetical protein HMPREF1210_00610 [Paenisporosarcina sp. HGH0030]